MKDGGKTVSKINVSSYSCVSKTCLIVKSSQNGEVLKCACNDFVYLSKFHFPEIRNDVSRRRNTEKEKFSRSC